MYMLDNVVRIVYYVNFDVVSNVQQYHFNHYVYIYMCVYTRTCAMIMTGFPVVVDVGAELGDIVTRVKSERNSGE